MKSTWSGISTANVWERSSTDSDEDSFVFQVDIGDGKLAGKRHRANLGMRTGWVKARNTIEQSEEEWMFKKYKALGSTEMEGSADLERGAAFFSICSLT